MTFKGPWLGYVLAGELQHNHQPNITTSLAGVYVACPHTASYGRNWYYDTFRAGASNLAC